MPAQSKISPELADELVRMYTHPTNPSTQIELVSYCLAQGVVISRRTVCTLLQERGARHYNERIDTPELRLLIASLFFQKCLPDRIIHEILKAEGYAIAFRTLVQLRVDMGLKRKLSLAEYETREEQFRAIVKEELDRGEITSYGRTMLHTYFRSTPSMQMLISRDRLFTIVKELDPVGVYRRKNDLQRRRGEYVTPGPDFCWSMDGYCKFEEFGIQIYAAIDAYSRNIIWIYVGVSGRTMVSVYQQFAVALKTRKHAPRLIRTDKGKETIMAADAQYLHARLTRGNVCTFRDCFIYGTSVANQRIEAWWAQISKGQLNNWLNHLRRLKWDGLYSKDSLADRITMKAIYLPIVRRMAFQFVEIWNVHTIRKNPGRPHSVKGRPHILYYYSDVGTQGTPIDEGFVDRMLEATKEWDMDGYLPQATHEWCKRKLEELGYPDGQVSSTKFDSTVQLREHEKAYRQLRSELQYYLTSGAYMAETSPPYGGVGWEPDVTMVVKDAYNDRLTNPHAPQEMDFPNDGRDELARPGDFDE